MGVPVRFRPRAPVTETLSAIVLTNIQPKITVAQSLHKIIIEFTVIVIT